MPQNPPLFLNRYRLLKQIGRGGMASIFLAEDIQGNVPVAIKFLAPQAAFPDTVKTRFRLEARSLAQLSHPNIVKILDYGEVDGHPFFTMEWMPGGTLADRLGKPLPYPEAAETLLPIACALEYAHLRGIIHRDVKPGNILLDEQGTPKLTDFGIAKFLVPVQGRALTEANTGIGTPEYMAPEQGLGHAVDQRTDIYSLGVIFFELITGRKPYLADTPLATMMQHAVQPLPRAGEIISSLPEKVDEVLLRALAKDPADRYQTMGDFIQQLGRLASLEVIPEEEVPGVNSSSAATIPAAADLPSTEIQPPAAPAGAAEPPPPLNPIDDHPESNRWMGFKHPSLVLALLIVGILSLLLIGILTVRGLPGNFGVGGLIAHPSITPTWPRISPLTGQDNQDIQSTLGAYPASLTATSVPQLTLAPISTSTATPTRPSTQISIPAPTSTRSAAISTPRPTQKVVSPPAPTKTKRNTPQPRTTSTPKPHPAA